MADSRGFRLALDAFRVDVDKRGVEFVREVALQSFTGVVMASPVGNATRWARNIERAARGKPPLPKGYVGGHFRKNWRLEVNASPVGEVAGEDATGAQAINDAVSKLLGVQSLAGLREITIGNNLPYGPALEDGWSKQAPQGMVAQTKAAVEARYGRVQG